MQTSPLQTKADNNNVCMFSSHSILSSFSSLSMISHSMTPLIIFLLLVLPSPVSSNSTNFNFKSFSFRNITLLGDSYLHNGSIGLTQKTQVPSSSSGTAIFNLPIRFYDPRTNHFASFSTNFTFLITNPNPESYGDGLTLFVSPFNFTLGGVGRYLGLFNSSSKIKNGSLVAIEFDTKLDEGLGDPSGNHVGFDVDSSISIKMADLDAFGVDLKSGNPISAWVDYNRDTFSLGVFLSCSGTKPRKPVLALNFDLSRHFDELMYVGFSASTEGSTEVHTIESWSFETFGLPAANLSSSTPHDSSDTHEIVKPAIPFTNSTGHSHKNLRFGLQIFGPIFSSTIFVLVLWFSIKKSKLIKCDDKSGIKNEFLKGPRKFSYRELSSATKGFHRSRIVGNGAFGTVYRAIDPKLGINYAVKRSTRAHESKSEFTAELTIIAGLRHKNLVQLQGWCIDKNELLLVYEFMPNGSLDKILYPQPGSGPCSGLNWDRRYNVAVGIASALAYLHQECDQRVIHRDIKTSNIMLDADFNPRLGDFGLARLMDHNMSPVSTLTAGTMGYLAPEYLQYGKYTEKTDVFSYGVVVLEVCCGRRPIDKEGEGKDSKLVNLVDWVWGLHSKDRIIEAADERLNGEFDKDQMLRLLIMGLSCVNPNSEERPSMRRVLQILNREVEPLIVPKVKPLLSLSLSASMKLLEIDADAEESTNSSSLYGGKIN